MGRYVTPRGVVVEVGDEAARAVGYKPASTQSEPTKKAPKKRASKKKSDSDN